MSTLIAPLQTSLIVSMGLMLLTGFGSPAVPTSENSSQLTTGNIDRVFVVSGDWAYNASGDLSETTGNLTVQRLQRTLQMAPLSQQKVLGNADATGIYTLEPMIHLQVANTYPDMAGRESIQQFALMNEEINQINPGAQPSPPPTPSKSVLTDLSRNE